MEKYPRGQRGSPAKGVVWDNRSEGSNPSFSATENLNQIFGLGFLFVYIEGFELGASNFSCVFAFWRKNSLGNCFAGGSREANPSFSATIKGTDFGVLFSWRKKSFGLVLWGLTSYDGQAEMGKSIVAKAKMRSSLSPPKATLFEPK